MLLSIAPCLLIVACGKVPRKHLDAQSNLSANTATPGQARLNINTASAAELENLPGVGAVLAERIIAHRQQYGPFRRAEHLIMVRGFSDHKFRALADLITVD